MLIIMKSTDYQILLRKSSQALRELDISHPKDMTDDLIEVYKHSKKLMPLVHLPVQSGSNKILNLMNRKHTIVNIMKYMIG